MKNRLKSFYAVTLAASILILIIISEQGGAAQSPGTAREARSVAGAESNVRTEMGFLSSVNRPLPIPGVYDLSFRVYRNGVLEPVSSLPVLSEGMILFAHIEDTSGNPAQSGTVTFEYCSYRGGPSNDIDRPDEAPKEACDAGLATWDRLARVSIGTCRDYAGSACLNFGIVRIPRDVGFRFKYTGPRGGIDSGASGAANFTWTAP